jgi:hypothetical protein
VAMGFLAGYLSYRVWLGDELIFISKYANIDLNELDNQLLQRESAQTGF